MKICRDLLFVFCISNFVHQLIAKSRHANRRSFLGLVFFLPFPQGFETGGKRKDEKTEGEVSDGMQNVKAQSHGDPRDGLFKGKAVRDGLYRRI